MVNSDLNKPKEEKANNYISPMTLKNFINLFLVSELFTAFTCLVFICDVCKYLALLEFNQLKM